jgi:hypothetical protein
VAASLSYRCYEARIHPLMVVMAVAHVGRRLRW